MKLLAVDCSSENLSFCIADGDKISTSVNRRLRFGASCLAGHLGRHFKRLGIAVKDFDAFVIGSGPGSFTGLRISFSLIKAFALSTNKPVISLESFYACAYTVKKQAEKITVIADARRQLLYCSSFLARDGLLKKKGKVALVSAAELEGRGGHLFVTYDRRLKEEISRRFPDIHFYPKEVYPQARFLLPAAREYINKGKYTPLERLTPLYVHPKTCQIRKAVSRKQ